MNIKPTKSTQDANIFANEPFRMKSSVSSPNFSQSVNTNEHPFTNTYGIGRNAKQRQQENHCFFNPEAQAHSHVDADFSYSKSFENEIGDKENSNRFNKSKPFSSRSYFNLSDFMNSSKQTQHDRYNNIYDQLYDTKRFWQPKNFPADINSTEVLCGTTLSGSNHFMSHFYLSFIFFACVVISFAKVPQSENKD